MANTNKSNITRKEQVKNCKKCKGKPKTEDLKLTGFKGTKCADKDCLMVIEYQKVI